MKDITKFACYMDEEDVYELAKEIIEGDTVDDVVKLLPYMDEDDVGKIAFDIVERKLNVNLKPFLCFMDEDDVDKLCELLTNATDDYGIVLDDLYPYASEKGIDKMFLHLSKQGIFDEKTLPYVSEECLHEFVINYCDNADFDIDIDAVYPYLDSKDIALLLKTYLKRHKNK